jgi:hypothetical protein
MFGVSLGIRVGNASISGGGVDADAQAYFDRVTTAGGTLTTTEKTAVNQLVIDLKANSLWTPMKAIYPMVGSSAAACAQNLKSSSFTGTFTSGWTFASTGVTPNGSSAYFDTGMNQSVNLSNDSVSLSYYSRTNSAISSFDIGGNNGSPNFFGAQLACYYTALGTIGHLHSYPTNSSISTSFSNTQAFYLTSRISSTSNKLFRNSTLLNTNTNARTSTLANVNFRLASDYVAFTNRECAFATIGDGLTDTQASNFYTSVQIFNQTLNRQVGAQIVSDADAQAYINRVYTAGGTLTNTEANAVNQLTIDMKSANVWTAMKAVYPMVGSSAAACAQNLKSSSFTGTFTSGWTFDSTGATPNGTSAYMNTGFIPNNNLTINSSHMSFYSRTNNIIGVDDFSAVSTGDLVNMRLIINLSGILYCDLNNASTNRLSISNANSLGYYIASRVSSTSLKVYKNSSIFGTNTVTNGGTQPLVNMYLSAANNVTTSSAVNFSNRECAFATIGDGLSDTQASALNTNIQTFQTTLSRNV